VAVQPPAAPQQATQTPRGTPAVPPLSLTGAPFFTQTGLASFYGGAHDGKITARGEIFDHRDLTAAHRTLPFGTMVRVTNLSNGRTVRVEITDRGPRIKSRVIDISLAAAREIGMQKKGITRVRVDAFRADQPGQN
jgi:rare lipoprotein A